MAATHEVKLIKQNTVLTASHLNQACKGNLAAFLLERYFCPFKDVALGTSTLTYRND